MNTTFVKTLFGIGTLNLNVQIELKSVFSPLIIFGFCFKRVVGHGQSLASWVLRARSGCNILSDHQRCIETSQPGAEKNYCTFSRTSRYHPPLWTSIFLEITCLSKAFCLV